MMDIIQPTNINTAGHLSPGIPSSFAAELLPDAPKMEIEAPETPLRNHTQSKLPTYRHVDLMQKLVVEPAALLEIQPFLARRTDLDLIPPRQVNLEQQPSSNNARTEPQTTANPQKKHTRTQSTPSSTSRDREAKTQSSPKSLSSPPAPPARLSRHYPADDISLSHSNHSIPPNDSNRISNLNTIPAQPPETLDVLGSLATKQPKATRRIHPAPFVTSNRKPNNDRPPLSMITQGFYDSHALEADSTTDWVAQQSRSLEPAESEQPPVSPAQPQSSPSTTDNSLARPLIKPIRAFKPSSRKSIGMSSRRTSRDPDETLRALDGFDDTSSTRRNSNSIQQQNQADLDYQTTSDESDLFLRTAREEGKSARQNNNSNSNSPGRAESRFSRTGQRSSLPFSSIAYNPSIPRRRGSDQESSNGARPIEQQEGVAQALTYRPTAKDRPTPPEDMTRNRYFTNNSRSNPTTPRILNSIERSPESSTSYGPRRTNPDVALPPRSSYRQSNLSYTTPRTYNSTPLVPRSTDMQETPETPRAAEGTESSVSTTAPSTVWDELEDLKSRIHRLELTGKLPPTSGAAMSRASNDRPPTATTTVTTISSSPKRTRVDSISQEEPAAGETSQTETHPLLHAALTKTKPILSPDVYKALEAATSDALAIASMMGTSGQPGPISSSQSTIGGPSTVSDRQVRRKADSMCRSLTELCLALSETQAELPSPMTNPVSKAIAVRPASRDRSELRVSTEGPHKTRQLVATDLTRMKSSPRALSRLEERRSSLLATSTLPSPLYTPSEVGTPTKSSAGRRTSLFLRTRRAATEEPEEDETRFRSPSRATTEIGRIRNSPREYTSQQPLPDRPAAVQSSLPVRRHYASTSLTNTVSPPMPPVSSLGGRRFLERSTPDRDSVVSRLAEDREQRKSSISQGFLSRTGSLTRKSRQSTPSESPSAGQAGNYQ